MRAPGYLALGALLVGCAGPLVEDCAHGNLDQRYCDANGDLVADPPGDPRMLLDPDRLIFAYTPVEDPAQFRDVWAGFLAHLEKAVSRDVLFFPVQSNSAQIEAMRAGRLHIAGFNTGSVPLAVNCAGFVPTTMMARADGSFGYEMEILTHRESGIESVPELRGRTLAFTSPTSNSGFKAPSVLLESEFGLVADQDFEPAFSGRHDNSVLGVLQRDYDAAAVANIVIDQVLARGVGSRDDLRVLYRSETFPTTAYGVSNRLDSDLAEAVIEAFYTFDWEGSALDAEFEESSFIPISYEGHWEVIRRIDVASGTSWRCR
ncbi:MAG: phosphate/phosphite/phosphonate ABC transporter substrate-binding protein [Gemmatimonadota bacterium]|uniref:Solute-binding protein family 3/N-terminal domain-containing protein n=1 Tax=marine metagenome TaxID=408172 RepID=A0A381NXS3_9ZZZZ|nr:phosphate/phosphite/phosphonate ABC transporter substrate-binding protein [Gemmatimonadota bacterium]MEE3184495.1 phosphate/phosphite/phosphonate ABC transporter substrate-binding protein [Gemmatimonadota bacterium]HAW91291.1 phosphate/phosphite/phosphonate ABC transporter substrate-binding protein [Gemmatimonadota bacterium]|tara:strand:- start:771 stop:1724 length:954 start_codon:yes stop_codon:yes gene_type:complete